MLGRRNETANWGLLGIRLGGKCSQMLLSLRVPFCSSTTGLLKKLCILNFFSFLYVFFTLEAFFHFLKSCKTFHGRTPYQIRTAANVSTADELTRAFNKRSTRNASPLPLSSMAKFAFQALLADNLV